MLASASARRIAGRPGRGGQGAGEGDGVLARSGCDLQHPGARRQVGTQNIQDRRRCCAPTAGEAEGHRASAAGLDGIEGLHPAQIQPDDHEARPDSALRMRPGRCHRGRNRAAVDAASQGVSIAACNTAVRSCYIWDGHGGDRSPGRRFRRVRVTSIPTIPGLAPGADPSRRADRLGRADRRPDQARPRPLVRRLRGREGRDRRRPDRQGHAEGAGSDQTPGRLLRRLGPQGRRPRREPHLHLFGRRSRTPARPTTGPIRSRCAPAWTACSTAAWPGGRCMSCRSRWARWARRSAPWASRSPTAAMSPSRWAS